MFRKILIANRGEIACRIMATARRMGIATVAVYSEADQDAVHVELADEAFCIGPPPAAESYLDMDALLEVAEQTEADAVHPGYGFLSENAGFAEALENRGIVFIGPPAAAIEAMGDKIAARRIAADAGVNVIPGQGEVIADAAGAARVAGELGYPVMVKAAAGGGGKGMRVVHAKQDLAEAIQSASNEAKSAFGDSRLFIEKFIENPRHIEIQVLADGHGNVVHLFERECSIQRRHQKVIEEAPSPYLKAPARRAMVAQAMALARAVEYRSAGTVEFIADPEGNFYFLEMNTRLQVEHPVTEMITGLDLVEHMIRIAAGEKLSLTQKEIKVKGWAIEARVYAEDPARGFVPSAGRLSRYGEPEEADGVRVDSGVREGSEISVYYDPLIAKLCAWGKTRAAAIDRLAEALDSYYIRGITHNLPFLSAVARHPRFRDGDFSTAFIEQEYPEGFTGAEPVAADRDALAAIAVLLHLRCLGQARSVSGTAAAAPVTGDWVVTLDAESLAVSAALPKGGDVHGIDITLAGQVLAVRGEWRPGAPVFRGEVNARSFVVEVDIEAEGFRLEHGGASVAAVVRSPRANELAALMPEKVPPDVSKVLASPMPGQVIAVEVKAGESVKAGQRLAVVEAMKMENVLRAERDGRIARVAVAAGDNISADQVILEFE